MHAGASSNNYKNLSHTENIQTGNYWHAFKIKNSKVLAMPYVRVT